jgi:uncharacterized protein (TIGR03086 family)
MSANLRNYIAAIIGLEHAIRNVDDKSWENPSPCEGWTVRDTAGHAMAVVNNIPTALGLSAAMDPFVDKPGQHAGESPYETWRSIRTKLFVAIDAPGALQTEMKAGGATMTVDNAMVPYFCDALIHSWDIARGSGGDDRMDPDLIGIAQSIYAAREAAGTLRVNNRYQAASTTTRTDPQSKLLAFVGRVV